jgi:RNA polymerase sigma-70 factor (ECF subfamily)
MRPRPRDDDCTNPSIFLRLNASDAGPREIAWNDFARRYGPIIAGFAYRVGARTQDVDDVVQDVMLGFFSTVPTFTYDPSKGRFRRYLKVCTVRAVCRRFDKIAKLKSVPLSSLDEQALEIEQVWNDVWEQQQLDRAIETIRQRHSDDKGFQAFDLNVVQGRSAQEAADALGLSVSGVYKARERIGQELREQLRTLAEEEG